VLVGAVNIHITGLLTLGDLIVGVGTGALAFFTWRLASATYQIDRRAAERESKTQERRVRGIARLVDGELATARRSFRAAIDHAQWQFGAPVPRAAWDRDGALIVEVISESKALSLISLFADLGTWATLTRDAEQKSATAKGIAAKPGTPMGTRVAKFVAQIDQAREDLRSLAYPTASDEDGAR
jgi:hypothetical protein